jgi:soluble P-type ATPase
LEPPTRFRFDDSVRSDACHIVASLKRQGYRLAILSGDRRAVVERIARDVGIETWRAELKPAGKIAWLDQCAAEGRKVLMIGDGLNDAPALAAAHASMSPAGAADISQRAADFVFQGEKLAPVLDAIGTAKRARSMALQNFAVAFHLRAARHGGPGYPAHRRHRHVDLIDPCHGQCRAPGGEVTSMTALAWLVPIALLLGALGLAAFMLALR